MHDGIVFDNVKLTLGSTDFNFDCAMEASVVTAISGPSGAGKSTLLNLIAGFEQPRSGTISIAGMDHTKTHPSQRPVSVVFQDHNLFAHLDLFTNVALGINPAMKLSVEDRYRAEQALARVGLAGLEKRMPGSLSGGERQRTAFARALVRNKPVLLLDEPFAALDTDLRLQMAALLLELHRETNNTIVMISHDQSEISRVADRVIHVEKGRAVIR